MVQKGTSSLGKDPCAQCQPTDLLVNLVNKEAMAELQRPGYMLDSG